MHRVTVLLVLLAACTKEPPREGPPAPAPAPALTLAPAPAPRPSHKITYDLEGLGTWKGMTCGCIYRSVIDLDAATIDSTDPGGGKTHRVLDPAEIRALRTLADAARVEPATPQAMATDMLEQLDVDDVHIQNNGPISRPAAARLVHEVVEQARFPAG